MFCKEQHISFISKSWESFFIIMEIGIKLIMVSGMISAMSQQVLFCLA